MGRGTEARGRPGEDPPALRLCLFGASGRMGQAVAEAVAADALVRLTAAVAPRGSAAVGQDVAALYGLPALAGVSVTDDPAAAVAAADVAIDFSLPVATPAYASACAAAGRPLVSGVTGLDAAAEAALDRAARQIPLLHATNLSVGVTVLERLVDLAARSLDPRFEIEVLEAHHHAKRDAPSGTALTLGRSAAAARGAEFDAVQAPSDRAGPRDPAQIGFAVVRAGDIAGEHTVFFAGPGERLELTHRAGSRAAFATGALRAACWLAAPGRGAGRFQMRDVLGLD